MDSEVTWSQIEIVSVVLSFNELIEEAFSVESLANADFENKATVFIWVG